jgi:REP element-mobilizing transposase RayT
MHIINEYYHIYNRGAHKAPIFLDKGDYERFLYLLYTSNDMRRIDLRRIKPNEVFNYKRDTLVNIFAYCLMPNHFHVALKETTERGVEKFMRKLCTSYAMYYNKKYNHSGTIFQGEYKSKHVGDDEYFRYLTQYIHLNPFGIEEPDMTKIAKSEHLEEAITYSRNYEYSSFKDYLGEIRPQSSILACAG